MPSPQTRPDRVLVQVRFFASLKERLGVGDAAVEVPVGATVEQVWQRATDGAQRPGQVLVAVNLEYGAWDQVVRNGDEVAFFPPVTGG